MPYCKIKNQLFGQKKKIDRLTTISGLRINSFTAQTPSWESRLGLSSRLGYSSRAARFPYDDSVGVRTQSSFGMYCVCYIRTSHVESRG